MPLLVLYRWVYQDATTFTPYVAETMDMPPVLLCKCWWQLLHDGLPASCLYSMGCSCVTPQADQTPANALMHVHAACFQESTRRGASTALGSMPPTAQAVFRVLAEAQLDDPTSPGITFATLFRMCRERWLVSNEQVRSALQGACTGSTHLRALNFMFAAQALRGFLAEFTDHELVAERMASLHGEEREVLHVPMEEDVLRKLLEANAAQ